MDSIARARQAHRDGAGDPAEISRAELIGALLEQWAEVNLRSFPWRAWSDSYRVIVTEVLLQQTRAVVVAAFVEGFFALYPRWEDLAEGDELELQRQLEPLGLHRRRASVLKRLGSSVIREPDLPLEDRPGVGQYTARAVAVSLENAPEAMVDVNFVRVLRRAFDGRWLADYRYDQRLQALAAGVVAGASDARTVNWAVLDVAASICRPRRPDCAGCPIGTQCVTGLSLSSAVRPGDAQGARRPKEG